MQHKISTVLLGMTLVVTTCLPGLRAEGFVARDKTDKPILLVAAASAEHLLGDMDFVFESAGRKEYATIARGFLALMGDLRGIDRTKPFGLMLLVDSGIAPDPVFVGFIPITDIQELTKTLQLQGVALKKKQGTQDRYALSTQDQTYQAAEQGGYLFVVRNEKSLDRTFPDPVALTVPILEKYDVAASMLLRNAPQDMKEMLIDFFRASSEWRRDKRRYETSDRHKIRTLQNQLLLNLAESFLQDGEALTFGWILSREKKQASLEIELETKPQSNLSRRLQRLGQLQNRIGRPANDQSAFSVSSTLQLTDVEKNLLEEASLQNFQNLIEKGIFPRNYRTEFDALFRSLQPTIQEGRFDSTLHIEGEAVGQFLLTGGIKLSGDKKVAVALTQLIQRLKADGNGLSVEMNAVKHHNISMHRLVWETNQPISRSLFGSRVALYFGIGSDTFWISMASEEKAWSALKEFIESGTSALGNVKPDGSRVVGFTTSISRWLPLISEDGSNNFWKTANKAFSQRDDKFRLNLEGSERNLILRLRFEEGFIRLAGRWIVQQIEETR